MTIKPKANDFLKAMNLDAGEPVPVSAAKPATAPVQEALASVKGKTTPARAGLKHLGGYCSPDVAEQFAILRARLNLDNSQLLTLAIDELYRKHVAKRAFGDK